MPRLHFEDFVSGTVTEYGPRSVTREEITAFAAEFDPQPMHLDEDAARNGPTGGLAASGWHSCGLMMRIIVDGFLRDSTSMGSPGVEEVQWRAPLRPGDVLRVRATVLATRASNTRPTMGFVRFRFSLVNAQDVEVMDLITNLMFGRRNGGQAA